MIPALGVCYYPEHWPKEIWAEDARRMVEAGLTYVRIGEFGWSKMEPTPGTLDWSWLDRAIDVLAAAGLKIVLGTPTATPPRWMLDKWPDMLACDAQGRPRTFGSRRHYCHSHEGYKTEAMRITRLMGERYGRDARVTAWQIDNEYGCHDTVLSYSAAARTAFRDWLGQHYQSPEALNSAWGNVFWSMGYGDIGQIDLPNLTVTQPNPAHDMAFRRFASDQVVAWNRAMVNVLRPLTKAPLIHNYMGRETDFDHWQMGQDLDVASWDSYPIGFLSDRIEASPEHKRRFLRQGDPDFQAFHHDLYRGVGQGRMWVMEQQPGPVNWAPWNPAPLPGMVRLWGLEAIAHGAEVVSFFRWRQMPVAQEQYHAGLLFPDSTDAPGLGDVRQLSKDLDALGHVEPTPGDVAIVFDYASEWASKVLPQGADYSYFRLVFSAYRALRRAGLNVDIVSPLHRDFADYGFVLVPGLVNLPDALVGALAQTPSIFGPRTGLATPELGQKVPAGPNLPGLDLHVRATESLPPDCGMPVNWGSIEHWMEHTSGTAPAPLRKPDGAPLIAGNDGTYYLTGWPDDRLWDHIVSWIADVCSQALDPQPGAQRKRKARQHVFTFDYSAESSAPKASWSSS